jgi:hypothetical protein
MIILSDKGYKFGAAGKISVSGWFSSRLRMSFSIVTQFRVRGYKYQKLPSLFLIFRLFSYFGWILKVSGPLILKGMFMNVSR